MHRKFPLPAGHLFAPRAQPHCHDGRQDMDGMWLTYLQMALKQRWKKAVHTSGRFDAATQASLAEVQQVTGCRDPDGYLDAPTWDAVFVTAPEDMNMPQP